MLTFKQFFNEELVKEKGTQYGSNPGGVHTDSETGEKFYVKHYKNSDQGKVEALTSNIYKHMGIHTLDPEFKQVNGKDSIVTKWNSDLKTMKPSHFEKLEPHQADQIGRMYHAAVLTKNWDIVGLEHDNIMMHKNGNLHAVDQGGSFHFRAMGESKPYGSDIGEHHSLRHNEHPSGHVFSTVFKNHPAAEHNGLHAVKNMDDEHVHGLFKNSGLSNWKDLHKNFMERKKKLLDKYK